MAMESIYRQRAGACLVQAYAELDSGDYRQASEKTWEAAVQAVKGVADARGWEHGDDASLWAAVDLLVAETQDAQLRRLFDVAHMLHVNFRDGTVAADAVKPMVNEVGHFVVNMRYL